MLVNRFLGVSNRILGYPEKELVFVYTESLNPDTKWVVKEKNPEYLTDAINIAARYEEIKRPRQREINFVRKVNYSKVTFPRKP